MTARSWTEAGTIISMRQATTARGVRSGAAAIRCGLRLLTTPRPTCITDGSFESGVDGWTGTSVRHEQCPHRKRIAPHHLDKKVPCRVMTFTRRASLFPSLATALTSLFSRRLATGTDDGLIRFSGLRLTAVVRSARPVSLQPISARQHRKPTSKPILHHARRRGGRHVPGHGAVFNANTVLTSSIHYRAREHHPHGN